MNTNLLQRYVQYSMASMLILAGYRLLANNDGKTLPDGRAVGIGVDDEGVYLTLPGIGQASYDIQSKASLSLTQWELIGGIEADDGLNIYRPPTSSEPSRYFRVLFPQPTLAAGEPAFVSGVGQDTVYIRGQYFYAGDSIRVGGVLLENVTFLSSTMLSGTLPVQPPGLYDVEVISGQSGAVLAVLHNALEVAPTLQRTLQEPSSWPPAGPAPQMGGRDPASGLATGRRSHIVPPRDSASGLPTGKRIHSPFARDPASGLPTGKRIHSPFARDPASGLPTGKRMHSPFARDPASGLPTGKRMHFLAVQDPPRGQATGKRMHKPFPALSSSGDPNGAGTYDVDDDCNGYSEAALCPHSGEIQVQVADLAVKGRGLDFVWTRTYRSRTGADSSQGTRWSHSYDVRCVQQGDNVLLHDGTGRVDTFRPQADGSYTCPGIFREGRFVAGAFRLTFADTGYWEFNPMDAASPISGKLARIQDRNSNALTCDYSSTGLLTGVIDTLGATNSIAYTPEGRVASVTDSTGRTVTYAYYSTGESGGTAGDLKSVTCPQITDTPDNNDFPAGKTIAYTYTAGQGDERCNHLLLAVTDASSQVASACVYDLEPASSSFQRCLSLQQGTEPPACFTYVALAPSPDNGFAAQRCIVNDPIGNVTALSFDLRNRLVSTREFTGRAVAGQPVTASSNRPTERLRESDPVFYETTFRSNNDNLYTHVTLSDGRACRYLYAGDADPSTRACKRPDLLSLEWDARATGGSDTDGDGASDLFKITTRFTYDPRFSQDPAYRKGWDGSVKGSSRSVGVDDDCDGIDNDCDSFFDGRDNDCDDTTEGPRQSTPSDCDGFVDGRDNDCDGIDQDCDGFVTFVTDPRGTVTSASYDERGNRIHAAVKGENCPIADYVYNSYGQCIAITNAVDGNGLRRVDTIAWGTCPQVVVRDATGAALTTTFERDNRGNVTRCIDPNGNDTLFTYNDLDQLVAIHSPLYEDSGTRGTSAIYHDAKNNVTGVVTDNRHPEGALIAENPTWTTLYEYDRLNRCIAVIQEVDPSTSITNRFEYNANGQLTAQLSPLAVAGTEPHNRVDHSYDERGLLFRSIAAPGSSIAATNEWSYNADGCPVAVKLADSSITASAYDGFGRPKSTTDALGNTTLCFFNAAGDLTRCRTLGETADLPGGTDNRLLSETSWNYDGLGRSTEQVDSFFDIFTELPVGDGSRTTLTAYAPSGQLTATVDDFGATNRYLYDTAGRLASVIGAQGHTSAIMRDPNGNVIQITTTSLSDLGGNPQQYRCDTTYDSRGHCITAVDNVGNTNRWFYDSRDLLVRCIDPRGNETTYLYDGVGRCPRTTSYDGACNAGENGACRGIVINTSQVEYDANSRVVGVTDVNTNRTSHTYDLRNRVATTVDPAGRTRQFSWNRSGRVASQQDANGTVVTFAYDSLQRLIRKDITPGVGVAPTTTFECFVYDGLSHCVAASNNLSMIAFTYDSLGNQVRVVQDGIPMNIVKNIKGLTTSITYPSGTTASYTYDLLEQVKTVSVNQDGLPPKLLAAYAYDAPDRLARITHADGTATDILWNGLVAPANPAGDYGWQEVAAISHGGVGGSPLIDERLYSYDRTQNKTLRAMTHAFDPVAGNALTNLWEYDALDRLRMSAPTDGANIPTTQSYVLDGKGNRISVTRDGVPELYTRSAAIPPADFQLDQYTTTPDGSNTYDAVGNLVQSTTPDGSALYTFDYAGRLVEVSASNGGGAPAPIVTFGYDAFGRRITKTVFASGQPPSVTSYLCDGMDNDCDGTVDDDEILATYQDGVLADIRIFVGSSAGGSGGCGRMFAPPIAILRAAGETLLTRCDELGNVLAVTDLKGVVVERYAYSDFGEPSFLAANGALLTDAVGAPVTSSPAGNPYLFHGMQWDGETGLLYRRHGDVSSDDGKDSRGVSPDSRNNTRFMISRAGQYISPDTTSSGATTHSRAFADNNPWTLKKEEGGRHTPFHNALRKKPGRTTYSNITLKSSSTRSGAGLQR